MTRPEIIALIRNLANINGINPDFMVKVAEKESSLNPRADNGKYRGLFQIGDGEARTLGVTDVFDPKQNTLGAIKYMKSNRKCLEKKITNWEEWYYYLAHQQGCSGATYLLQNKDKNINEIKSTARRNILSNIPKSKRSQMIKVSDFLDHWKSILQPNDSVAPEPKPTSEISEKKKTTTTETTSPTNNLPLILAIVFALLVSLYVVIKG